MPEITPDGWFTFAERDPGPIGKTNGGRNGVKGYVPHSAEGYWPTLKHLLHTGPASWHLSNLQNGRLIQHYPIFAQTWTSGAGYPNNNMPSSENEGVAGEPLTDPQVDNNVRVIRSLSEYGNWIPRRPVSQFDKTATLYEHNEMVRFGGKYTECPSGRIPWARILTALQEDDMAIELVWDKTNQRLFVLGQGDPRWIAGAAEAQELRAVFGPEKRALSWAALQALGAK